MAQVLVKDVEVMERTHRGVGRCKCAFWFALVHDIVGVSILLTGVFADIFCRDLFIYSGAVVIFLSLIWWVFWFSGNIEVPPEELQDDVGLGKSKNMRISGVVRKVSNRLNGIRNSFRRNLRENRERPQTIDRKATVSQPQNPVCLSVIYQKTTYASHNEFTGKSMRM
ncbi:hypothetical protein DPEC_G00357800 [Dallia pectoralis]|uniref:Uncharacterized protein n=1 Tax=Dallia pectoralis TaxID=75939 RepID=A0ACC2F051_DALPE|nr:hypothetical protein DPEC_G00357800 [Dallia pectoralis]